MLARTRARTPEPGPTLSPSPSPKPRQVAALKARIASLLRADPAAIRLRRGGPRGAHLRAEAETLVGVGGASLADGSSVYVERGAPLRATDALVAVHWCEAPAPDEAAGSGGGGGGERRGSRDVRPPRRTRGAPSHHS